MKAEDYKKHQQAAKTGTIKDDSNPIFIFSTTYTELLQRAIAGEYDLIELAKIELKNRGINI